MRISKKNPISPHRSIIDKSRLTTEYADKLPNHIAIIMDGNGRWAKKKGMPRTFGHKEGSKTAKKITKISAQLGIKYLSLYTFSADNWKRPKKEVLTIMKLIEENLRKEIQELHANNIKVNLLGRKDGLPDTLLRTFKDAEKLTAQNSALNLQIAINYSGYYEIIDAVKSIVREGFDPEFIDEELLRTKLYFPELPFPDLIIRTGGEFRISNFLLWQSAYSELWFSEILWPDFKTEDYENALMDYILRDRRYGRVTGGK